MCPFRTSRSSVVTAPKRNCCFCPDFDVHPLEQKLSTQSKKNITFYTHTHTHTHPHYDPGVDSASNRNEYQEYFLGGKAAGAYSRQTYHLHVLIVLKYGSLNLLGLSRSVIGLFYIYIYMCVCVCVCVCVCLYKHTHTHSVWRNVYQKLEARSERHGVIPTS